MPALKLGTIDIGGDGKEVLLEAIKKKYHYSLDKEDVGFSDPERVTVPNPTHNTLIYIGPKATSGYYGIKKIYYNRIHVSELGRIRVAKGTATKVSELLPSINLKYGIHVKNEDIFDEVLPDITPPQTEVEINFKFRDTSVVFYGSSKIQLGNSDPSGGGASYRPAGELLHAFCDGVDKKGVYTDGMGAAEIKLITANSSECGYNPGHTVGVKSQLLIAATHYTDQAGLTHTSLNVGEGNGWAFATFKLTKALNEDVKLKAQITFNEAEAADIESMQMSIGGANFTDITIPGDITIPAGQTDVTIRFKYAADQKTEGDESFNLSLSKYPGDAKITNTDPLIVKFVIEDTSKAPIVHPSLGTVIGVKCSSGHLYEMVADGQGGYTDRLKEKDSLVCMAKGKAAGTVLKTACAGTTQKKWIADGHDSYILTETLNSTDCGYNTNPAIGTILRAYCENGNQWFEIANGSGGKTKENKGPSSSCEHRLQILKRSSSLVNIRRLVDPSYQSIGGPLLDPVVTGTDVRLPAAMKLVSSDTVSSGRWYWEFTYLAENNSIPQSWFGIAAGTVAYIYNPGLYSGTEQALYELRPNNANGYISHHAPDAWWTSENISSEIGVKIHPLYIQYLDGINSWKTVPNVIAKSGDTFGIYLDLVDMRMKVYFKGVAVPELEFDLQRFKQRQFYLSAGAGVACNFKLNLGQEDFKYQVEGGYNKGFGVPDEQYFSAGSPLRFWCESSLLKAEVANGGGSSKLVYIGAPELVKNITSATGLPCKFSPGRNYIGDAEPDKDKAFYLDNWPSLSVMPDNKTRLLATNSGNTYPVLLKKSVTDNDSLLSTSPVRIGTAPNEYMTLQVQPASSSLPRDFSSDVYTLPNKDSYWSKLEDMELSLDFVIDSTYTYADTGERRNSVAFNQSSNLVRANEALMSLHVYKKTTAGTDVDFDRYIRADLILVESSNYPTHVKFKVRITHKDPAAAVKDKVWESDVIKIPTKAGVVFKQISAQLKLTKTKAVFNFAGLASVEATFTEQEYKTGEEFIPAFSFNRKELSAIYIDSLYWGGYRGHNPYHKAAAISYACKDVGSSKTGFKLLHNLGRSPNEVQTQSNKDIDCSAPAELLAEVTEYDWQSTYKDIARLAISEPRLSMSYITNNEDSRSYPGSLPENYKLLGNAASQSEFEDCPSLATAYINLNTEYGDEDYRNVIYVNSAEAKKEAAAKKQEGISVLRPLYNAGKLFISTDTPDTKATKLDVHTGVYDLCTSFSVDSYYTFNIGIRTNRNTAIQIYHNADDKALISLAFIGYDKSISRYEIDRPILVVDLHYKSATKKTEARNSKWWAKVYDSWDRSTPIITTSETDIGNVMLGQALLSTRVQVNTYIQGNQPKISITAMLGLQTLTWLENVSEEVANKFKDRTFVPVLYWNRTIMLSIFLRRFVWKYSPR